MKHDMKLRSNKALFIRTSTISMVAIAMALQGVIEIKP
ncbi:hypothetical protein ECAE60S_01495 [Eoetvoesiella caeni]